MLTLTQYDQIKKKYGKTASWAIWAEEGKTPKSNICDLSIFNDNRILKILNPNYVFVGLNPSVQDADKDTWHNFHSKDTKRQNDYKLRYALKNTKFWGAYLTDLVSDVEETNSNKVSISVKNVNKTSFKSRDEEEVAGYADLVEHILNDYSVIPLNENYIKQLHKILLSHSSKDIDHRGEYKTSSNRVAAFDADGHEIGSIFETATPFDTPRLMGELLDWTNLNLKERYLHPIVVIGVFVVHFLSVHPFKDGNGRMSRALTTMLMLQSGYSYMPYASMESIIEASKGMYYRAFEGNTTHAQKARMDRNHNAICLDIQNRYPAYHNFWLRNSGRSGTRFRLRLGCIPLFKVKNNKVYLFEFIPLFTIKWR